MLNHGPTWESLIQAGLGGVSGLGVISVRSCRGQGPQEPTLLPFSQGGFPCSPRSRREDARTELATCPSPMLSRAPE